ncbi:hypothetical protein ABIB85_003239 [Bradyrhizobium sp. JR1.5]|uniref:hypothetical protein n=1 Tax=unclassified Bradyrhizobium TaxID=2631580 RepID=UPI00339AC348
MEIPIIWSIRLTYWRLTAPSARQPMRADFDQSGPAGQAIDQAEQLTQHDRTPLLINLGSVILHRFRPSSLGRKNDFVGKVKGFVGSTGAKPAHAGVRACRSNGRWPGARRF